MGNVPWLTIIGLGEDGPKGLGPASRSALETADVIFGAARHVSILADLGFDIRVWPVPFADGLPMLDAVEGQQVAVLASGDPFWFGAGRILAERYGANALRTLPGPSTFSQVAARLGWGLEHTVCLGLHAAPIEGIRSHLAKSQKIIALMRDGAAVNTLCAFLSELGFGASEMTVFQAVGGPRERISQGTAETLNGGTYAHPVAVAVRVAGDGVPLPQVPGLPDDLFAHDGQLTKRHVRAVTLSTLAPRHGEHLWDIGGGAGSIAIEWCLASPSTTASVIEMASDRAKRIRKNATSLGIDRVGVIEAVAPQGLAELARPDAVFVGGGLSEDLLEAVRSRVPTGTRLVANGVTLEAQSLLTRAHETHGGTLARIDVALAEPLGRKRGWKPSYPIVQWSVVL